MTTKKSKEKVPTNLSQPTIEDNNYVCAEQENSS